MSASESLTTFSPELIRNIAESFGTPVFVYDEQALVQAAESALAFPNAFGLTARYAMKANSSRAILKIITDAGMHIDASSGYEVERALLAGIRPEKIMLTGQAPAHNLETIVPQGVHFNATSFQQLEDFGRLFPGSSLGVRINPGLGSGGTNRTNVGGPASSFGIWHEHLEQVKKTAAQYSLTIKRIHTHIGSGSDPAVWQKVAAMSIELLHQFPAADTLNLGGGYKVARMSYEQGADMQEIGKPVVEIFREFAEKTGRKIHLEIEPGTFMTANAGYLLAEVVGVTNTGPEGYRFFKLNTGMTEILRPSLYGSQHPLTVIPQQEGAAETQVEAIVVGHCCESGDILTPEEGDPEGLLPRKLLSATPGDLMLIGGAGAYCASMSAKNYNSFPEAAEVLVTSSGTPRLIRRRQTMEQMLANELD